MRMFVALITTTERSPHLKPHQTLQTLRSLKLTGMADAYEAQMNQPETHDLPFDERIAILVDREVSARENRKLSRNLRAAKFRDSACLEDIDYRSQRGLQKSQVAALGNCQWVRSHQNLCITGPTGTGKTYLACALGNQACRQGLSARYFRLPRLLESLKIARGDGSLLRTMAALAKVDLLVLDDWGLQKPAAQERTDLLEVLEDRYKNRSTLVASQLPIKAWHGYLGEATLADAILDRLVHNAHKLALAGESMRRKNPGIDADPGRG
jgi:DNA replication protein DnaC